jgi:hypothetical protein
MMIDAERRRATVAPGEAEKELSQIDDFEPPFVRVAGRHVPEWLEPLVGN